MAIYRTKTNSYDRSTALAHPLSSTKKRNIKAKKMQSTTWIDGTKWDFTNPAEQNNLWKGWADDYTTESVDMTSEHLKEGREPDNVMWQRGEGWSEWGVSYAFNKINLIDSSLQHRQTPLERWHDDNEARVNHPGFTVTAGGFICEVDT